MIRLLIILVFGQAQAAQGPSSGLIVTEHAAFEELTHSSIPER